MMNMSHVQYPVPSEVSGVVVFEVVFTNVDSVESDRTVTFLKNYKA